MPLKACILFSLSKISLRYIYSRFRQSQKFRSLGEKIISPLRSLYVLRTSDLTVKTHAKAPIPRQQ